MTCFIFSESIHTWSMVCSNDGMIRYVLCFALGGNKQDHLIDQFMEVPIGEMRLFWSHQIQEFRNEIVHPHGFFHGHLIEIPSEFLIVVFMRQKLNEGADRR